MAGENLQIVRRVYDAFARGEFQSALEIYDPHVVFGRDVSGVYWGVDGLKDYMRKVFDAWSSVTIEAEEITEVGENVLAAIRMRVVGCGSGVPVDLRYFHLWTFRGGLVIRLEVHPTREQALEALGPVSTP